MRLHRLLHPAQRAGGGVIAPIAILATATVCLATSRVAHAQWSVGTVSYVVNSYPSGSNGTPATAGAAAATTPPATTAPPLVKAIATGAYSTAHPFGGSTAAINVTATQNFTWGGGGTPTDFNVQGTGRAVLKKDTPGSGSGGSVSAYIDGFADAGLGTGSWNDPTYSPYTLNGTATEVSASVARVTVILRAYSSGGWQSGPSSYDIEADTSATFVIVP